MNTPLINTTTISGRVHSVETCGTVDGPGLRFVIFMKGCPLRCQYCHNPDCRYWDNSQTTPVEQLMHEISSYQYYIRPPGGVTISGGEPLMQPYFVREVFKHCKELGIHTALDTSGYCNLNVAKDVLEYVDLVLLDIKSFDPAIFLEVTGVPIEPTLQMAQYLNEVQKPAWIRFVLVPGLTDSPHNVRGLAEFVATLKNVERLEVLPFHKMGEYKWEQLGYDYKLKNTLPPTREAVEEVVQIFRDAAQGRFKVIAGGSPS